jgi:acyl-CoA thioesterase-1
LLIVLLALAAAGALAAGCGPAPEPPHAATGTVPASGGSGGGSGGGGTLQIVFLGDSLTSGSGLLTEQAYPALVQKKFAADGYSNVEAVNAGVTADTTAGALRRVEQALSSDTRILVVALGGNDFLRGLSVSQTHDNLAGIIDVALNRNVAVLLVGMEAPPNLGEDYRGAFREIFMRLLSEYRGRIALLPFLLEGVAGVPSLNQPDGIHPNADGSRIVADSLYQKLQPMVDAMGH